MNEIIKMLSEKNTHIIDVRNEWEFEEGHVPDAINIPLDQIPARIVEFKKMDGPIILYCRSGSRSGVAVQILKQAGLSNVYNGGSVMDLQRALLN